MSGQDISFEQMEKWFSEIKGIPADRIKNDSMRYEKHGCITHLFRVICGLDSAVLGEVEIIRQVKQAYTIAQERKQTDAEMNLIFQAALRLAKEVAETSFMTRLPVSVGTLACLAVLEFLGDVEADNSMYNMDADMESVHKEKHVLIISVTDSPHYTSALAGWKIGVVGTAALRQKLRGLFEEKGASLFSICNMHVRECEDMGRLDVALKNINQYQWIAFTSQNGIRLFFEHVRALRIDFRKFADIKFAVVGSGCREALSQYGFYADYMPEYYTTESLATGLLKLVKPGEKILVPRAKEGSPVLGKIFAEHAVDAEILPIYDVSGEKTENWKYLDDFDAIVFASASGVHAFKKCLADSGTTNWECTRKEKHILLGAIGQVTAEALINCGFRADAIPAQCDAVHLVSKLEVAAKQMRI